MPIGMDAQILKDQYLVNVYFLEDHLFHGGLRNNRLSQDHQVKLNIEL